MCTCTAYYARTSNHIGTGINSRHCENVTSLFIQFSRHSSEREREREGGREGKPRRFHDYERPIEADPIFETCQPLRQADRRPRGHGSRISCEALSHSRCLATVETISLNLCTPARQWRWRWRHSYRRCSRGRNIFTEEEAKKKKKERRGCRRNNKAYGGACARHRGRRGDAFHSCDVIGLSAFLRRENARRAEGWAILHPGIRQRGHTPHSPSLPIKRAAEAFLDRPFGGGAASR